MNLASYAVSDANSKGRVYPVSPSADRTEFQRDYTRVLHSQAFRCLQHKTQVFANHEGYNFRTRLTHSLEVEQLSRSVARKLNLNEDFAGVLAIGHDLGHAPFGHLGQDVLNEAMQAHGGFEHNLQALRIVDLLESPYPHHVGLNLMFETREGLLKHCSVRNAQSLGDVARRHLDCTSPPLEVQVVDWCDAIAYIHADLEDSLTMGVLTPERLCEAPGYLEAWSKVQGNFPGRALPTSADLQAGDRESKRQAEAMVKTILREMLHIAVADLIVASRQAIEDSNVKTLDDVRAQPELIRFSPARLEQHLALKRYSRQEIYDHAHILGNRRIHEKALHDLFEIYEKHPEELPGRGIDPKEVFHRSLADNMASMPDRQVLSEHVRLCSNAVLQEAAKPVTVESSPRRRTLKP